MERYGQIRREYEFGAGSIIGVAQKLGVHRRTVREAVRSALPARRKKTVRPHLKIAPAAAFIDAVLETDRKAPRKQRHTAKRIWERIRLEVPGCTAAENQQFYDVRWRTLSEFRRAPGWENTPLWISYEPAIGPVTMRGFDLKPDWIIFGGESGSRRHRWMLLGQKPSRANVRSLIARFS